MDNGKSKYIKEKGARSNSIYIKDKDRNTRYSKSSDSSGDGLSARARYLEMLEREQAMKEAFHQIETGERPAPKPEPEPEAIPEEKEEKVSYFKSTKPEPSAFAYGDDTESVSSAGVEAKPMANEDEDEKLFRKIWVRNIITCVILGAIALVMQIVNFRLPLTPMHMRMDFSALPELLVAVAFGPIAGIAVIVAKNIFYVLFMHTSVLATAISNIILDSLFVGIASSIYARGVFSPMAIERRMVARMENPDNVPDDRRRMIIKGGLIGAVVTTALSYVTIMYIIYPIIFRQFGSYGYTAEKYIYYYQDAITSLKSHLPASIGGILADITSLSQGVLTYNLPFTFIKLVLVSVIVALLFKPLSKILFYRPTIDPEDLEMMRQQRQMPPKQ